MNRRELIHNGWRVAIALSCILGSMGTLDAHAATGTGYLTVVKPRGLRFASPGTTHVDLTLPPVQSEESREPRGDAEPTVHLGDLPPFVIPGSPLEILFTPATEVPFFAGPDSSGETGDASDDDPVSRDVILDYFVSVQSGTNNVGGVVVPVRFTPPTPTSPAGSRATYRTR